MVSCQALSDEPLFGSDYMAKMARAAKEGGASGIRANSVVDIRAIKKEVDLPVIGIIKMDYPDSPVRITPTLEEVKALVDEGVDIIAVDATNRTRPGNISLDAFYAAVRERYPNQLLMADISTVEEAVRASEMGFDLVATTLVGYTPYSEGNDPLETLKEIVEKVDAKIIAEGNINDPIKAKNALNIGAYAVVVGSAITRPQLITQAFVAEMQKNIRGVCL